MGRRISIAAAILGLALMLVTVFAIASPAIAHHKDKHDKGSPAARSGGGPDEYTEDEDGDGRPHEYHGTGAWSDPNADNRHPSGRDRHEENGTGPQGRSQSEPDADSGTCTTPDQGKCDRGTDKPGPAAVRLYPTDARWDIYDQDGNNGCGNDDDFDDDNNGWCGKQKAEQAEESQVLGEEVTKEQHEAKVEAEQEVLGEVVTKTAPEAGGEVIGNVVRPTGRGVLAFTGASVLISLLAALALAAAGVGLLRAARTRSSS